jgi:hypothetical protein
LSISNLAYYLQARVQQPTQIDPSRLKVGT